MSDDGYQTERSTVPATDREFEESRLAGGLVGVLAIVAATVVLTVAALAIAALVAWLL